MEGSGFAVFFAIFVQVGVQEKLPLFKFSSHPKDVLRDLLALDHENISVELLSLFSFGHCES